jgi:hypothetical protein
MILKRNNIQVVGMEYLSELKPPFLVMANHAHTFDPFFISSASPRSHTVGSWCVSLQDEGNEKHDGKMDWSHCKATRQERFIHD